MTLKRSLGYLFGLGDHTAAWNGQEEKGERIELEQTMAVLWLQEISSVVKYPPIAFNLPAAMETPSLAELSVSRGRGPDLIERLRSTGPSAICTLDISAVHASVPRVATSCQEQTGPAARIHQVSTPAFTGNPNVGACPGWAAGASGTAALLTCCALHPFDLVKTRMQVAAVTGGAIPRYSSTRSAITRIFKQEGLRGLWKGVGVTATASSTSWACFRYIFDNFSASFPKWRVALFGHSHQSTEVAERTSVDDVASGLLAGIVVTGLTHPLWLAKARMEMQAKETEVGRPVIEGVAGWPRFRNGFRCILSAARGGISECYRGIGPALALAPHAAIQIAAYERLKRNQ
ncbi:folate transporter 1, chloroplastic [Cyclospora cayetanensis]|uniref:Folate transporter 1, chloroplastic n=1 Tax=Cyclospora cayetanensis TaxID=88456 RepID=A0A6P6RSH3_9EIME|nr:folate transporter 1, chloroplastic [Cyclospora cayetanensis]